jgi:ABC-type uncharacterized transport system substrate-binding protein
MMRRRDFMTLLGGAAAAWPVAVRAQQGGRMRRVGVLQATAENDQETQVRTEAFRKELAALGWTEGRDILIDYRYAAGDAARIKAYAAEIVSAGPDLILAHSTPVVAALRQGNPVPIVFVQVTDPIGQGFVASLARPGGNITGVFYRQPELAAKQLELLTQAFPERSRFAILYDANSADQFSAAEEAARSMPLELRPLKLEKPPYDFAAAFATMAQGGAQVVLVLSSPSFVEHRPQIGALAIAHRLPTMFVFKSYVAAGGLMSYGVEQLAMYRRLAAFVEKILKGTKPADLPVEQPTKFEFVVNLKTARAIGVELPTSILLRADEVIE